MQRARPVLLTALAAIRRSFRSPPGLLGTLAYTLIGGTLGNHHDPYLPAGHVRDLVPHPSGEHGTTDRVAPSEVIPLCRTGRGTWPGQVPAASGG